MPGSNPFLSKRHNIITIWSSTEWKLCSARACLTIFFLVYPYCLAKEALDRIAFEKNGFSRVLFKCGGPWIVLLHPGDDVCCGIRRCVWLGSWALAKKNTHRREKERKETWQEMKRNSTHASNGESTVDDVKVFSLGQTDSDGRFLHLRNGHCIGRVTLLQEFLFDSLRTTA